MKGERSELRLFNFCILAVLSPLFFSEVFKVGEEASFYYVNPHDSSSSTLMTSLKIKGESTYFIHKNIFISFRSDTKKKDFVNVSICSWFDKRRQNL